MVAMPKELTDCFPGDAGILPYQIHRDLARKRYMLTTLFAPDNLDAHAEFSRHLG
jgi:hypothetical protein